jgi:cell division transport system permease protein
VFSVLIVLILIKIPDFFSKIAQKPLSFFSYLFFAYFCANHFDKTLFLLKDYFDKYQKSRLIKTNISVVISISIVLFLLGILGFFVLNSKNITNHFKEKIVLTVFFKKDAKLSEIKAFEKKLKMKKEVKSVKFVSKKEAAGSLQKELGEDFIKFLGDNPLQDNLEVTLKGQYVTQQKIDSLKQSWEKNSNISDVSYEYFRPLVKVLNQNIKKLSAWIGIISGVFILLIYLLINSAIRLSIYSKRFSIHTMQMVGATKSFIRRPFLYKSVALGMVGATIALLGLFFLIYFIDSYFPDFKLLRDIKLLALLALIIYLIGIGITFISTFFATNHFLKMRNDQLHY